MIVTMHHDLNVRWMVDSALAYGGLKQFRIQNSSAPRMRMQSSRRKSLAAIDSHSECVPTVDGANPLHPWLAERKEAYSLRPKVKEPVRVRFAPGQASSG